jgi:hypothetical protein
MPHTMFLILRVCEFIGEPSSFRGAGAAREPGTHEHRSRNELKSRCSWVPGPALWAVPE